MVHREIKIQSSVTLYLFQTCDLFRNIYEWIILSVSQNDSFSNWTDLVIQSMIQLRAYWRGRL